MKDKIVFQMIMDYKAYRRIMIASRIAVTLVVAGALAALCAVSVPLGVISAVVAAIFGAMWIIFSLGKEISYTVFEDRIYIKHRGSEGKTVAMSDVTAVSLRRAFYEKDLGTGTIYFTARVGGRKKRYKLSHVFDPEPIAKYIDESKGRRGEQ